MAFQTHEKQGLMWLTSESLSLPGLVHGFSTRPGGVSAPPWDSLNLGPSRGDGMECLRENYRRFCAAIGTDVYRTVLSRQVHEDNVRLVTAEDAGKGLWQERDYTSVDAMVCNIPGIALTVFSADCGITLLYDPVHRAIGAAIGQCCFETDDDVPAALQAALGSEAAPYMVQRGPKWHIDLKGLNAHLLRSIGVEHIDVCPHCTACRPDLYWSHRKMGNERGLQVAMIALRDGEDGL